MYLSRDGLIVSHVSMKREGEKLYLFTAFSAFPMLVSQGGEPSLFSDEPLVLLERQANCTSSNLGVFVIPEFIQSINTSSRDLRKARYVKNCRQVAADIVG
jgi:hypothetical protein